MVIISKGLECCDSRPEEECKGGVFYAQKDFVKSFGSRFERGDNFAVADNDTITDTFDNGMGNWSKISGEADATVSDGKMLLPQVQTTNSYWKTTSVFSLTEWPQQPLKEVEFNLSGNLNGSQMTYVQFIYYYTDENNYHYLSVRGDSSGNLWMNNDTVKDGKTVGNKECDSLKSDVATMVQINGFPKDASNKDLKI